MKQKIMIYTVLLTVAVICTGCGGWILTGVWAFLSTPHPNPHNFSYIVKFRDIEYKEHVIALVHHPSDRIARRPAPLRGRTETEIYLELPNEYLMLRTDTGIGSMVWDDNHPVALTTKWSKHDDRIEYPTEYILDECPFTEIYDLNERYPGEKYPPEDIKAAGGLETYFTELVTKMIEEDGTPKQLGKWMGDSWKYYPELCNEGM